MLEHSPVKWLDDDAWLSLPVLHRAVILAYVEADVKRVRETGGANRGDELDKYFKAARMKPGVPWCALFVTWCLVEAGWPRSLLPGATASTCAWHAWATGQGILTTDMRELQRGDLFVRCNRRTWRGHIGVHVKNDGKTMTTLEGNTNKAGSREGDGAYRKVRRWRQGVHYGILLHRLLPQQQEYLLWLEEGASQ
jgi:hypothetical protein